MSIVNDDNLQFSWLKKEKKRIEEARKRRYLHFDARINKIGKKLAKEIWSPDYIVRRFFYPFINDDKVERKYKTESGKQIVKPKIRPICYASHKDAVIFSWYAHILNYLYEKVLTRLDIYNHVLAYRSLDKKNNTNFAKDVFDIIDKKGKCVALCFDIQGFYNNLDHKLIKKIWRKLLDKEGLLENGNLPKDHYAVYKAITQYSYVKRENIYKIFGIKKREDKKLSSICSLDEYKKIVRKVGLIKKHNQKKGIPQGVAVSCVLSNAYMLNFDINILGYVKSFAGSYYRYCDDIIVVCDRSNYLKITEFIKNEIKKLKLKIQDKKTEIRFFFGNGMQCLNENGFDDRLQYLGFETDGKNVYYRGKTLAKFHRKITWSVKKEVRRAKRLKNNIARRKIYKRHVHPSKTGFLSYAKRADKTFNNIALKKQVAPNKLIKSIKKKIDSYKK